MVKTLKKETKIDHHAEIVTKVDSILQTIEGLMENPLFIDGIHGEQELSLDLAVDLFTNIKVGTAITALSISDHIEGARSGATGFIRTAGTNVTDLSLIDVNGEFIKDEQYKGKWYYPKKKKVERSREIMMISKRLIGFLFIGFRRTQYITSFRVVAGASGCLTVKN